jgi:cytochrome c-type biogenesis protein CcmH/NrfG
MLLVVAGVVAVLLALVALYQRFLAPDAATLARIRQQQAAESLAMQGDAAGALEKVEQALVSSPRDPYLLVFKGTLQQELGQDPAAEQAFETAQAVLGDRVAFLLARGETYLLLRRAPAALADARAAVELNPQTAAGYMLLGRAYEITEDYPQAIFAYQQASMLAEEQGDFQTSAAARVAMGVLMQR